MYLFYIFINKKVGKLWDLVNKKLEKKIWTGGYNLLSIVKWSDNYIIFADNNIHKSLKILDICQMKIISSIAGQQETNNLHLNN